MANGDDNDDIKNIGKNAGGDFYERQNILGEVSERIKNPKPIETIDNPYKLDIGDKKVSSVLGANLQTFYYTQAAPALNGLPQNPGRDLLHRHAASVAAPSMRELQIEQTLARRTAQFQNQIKDLVGQIYNYQNQLKNARLKKDERDSLNKKLAEANFRLSTVTERAAAVESRLKEQLSSLGVARETSAQKRLVQASISATSAAATTTDVNALMKDPEIIGHAVQIAAQQSPFDIKQQKEAGQEMIMASAGRIEHLAGIASATKGADQFVGQFEERKNQLRKQAALSLAQNMQRRQRTDIESVINDSGQVVERIGKERQRQAIQEDVAEMSNALGKDSNAKFEIYKQEKSRLSSIEDSIIAAFEKFKKALNEDADAAEQHRQELLKLEDEEEKQRALVSELGKQGFGKGGDDGGMIWPNLKRALDGVASLISNAGTIGLAITDYKRYDQIGSQHEMMGLRKQAAELTNKQFFDAVNAAHGDMGALRRVTGGIYEDAMKRGQQMWDREDKLMNSELKARGAILFGNVGHSVTHEIDENINGRGAGAGAGKLALFTAATGNPELAESIEAGGLAYSTAVSTTNVLANNAENASGLARRGLAGYRGIPQAAARFQGINDYLALNDEENKAYDYATNQYREYATSMTLATRGLGVGPMSGSSTYGTGLGDLAPLGPAQGMKAFATRRQVFGNNLPHESLPPSASKAVPYDQLSHENKKEVKAALSPQVQTNMDSPSPIHIPSFGSGAFGHLLSSGLQWAANKVSPLIDKAKNAIIDSYVGTDIKGVQEALSGKKQETKIAPTTEVSAKAKEAVHSPNSSDYVTMRSAIALDESGGKVNARSPYSSAKGMYQFTGAWDSYFNKKMGMSYSDMVSIADSGNKQDIERSADLQTQAFDLYYKDKVSPWLKRAHKLKGAEGLTDAELTALYHRSGEGGATEYLKTGYDRFAGTPGNIGAAEYMALTDKTMHKSPTERLSKLLSADKNYYEQTAGNYSLSRADQPQDPIESKNRREMILRELMDVRKSGAVMAETGMGKDEMARLTSMGVHELGAQFGGLSDLRFVGNLQRTGYMTSDEAMSRIGTLSNVGGGTKDLEAILQRAVMQGMDASKNVGQLVQGISDMSRRSATMGISTVVGNTETLSRSVGALGGIPENMRVEAARAAADAMEKGMSGRDLNVENVMEWANIRRRIPGLHTAQMRSITAMGAGEVQTLMSAINHPENKKAYNDALHLLDVRGLNMDFTDGKGNINADKVRELARIKQEKGFESLTYWGNMNLDQRKAALKEYETSGSLAGWKNSKIDWQRRLYNDYNANVSFKEGVDAQSALAAGDFFHDAKKSNIQKKPSAFNSHAEDVAARSGAEADARMISEGAKMIRDSIGGFKQLAETINNVAKTLSPLKASSAAKGASDAMAPAVGVLGDKFGHGVDAFGNHVSSFRSVIHDLTVYLSKIGITSPSATSDPNHHSGGITMPRPVTPPTSKKHS